MKLRAVITIGALAPALFLGLPHAQADVKYACGTGAVNCGTVVLTHTGGQCSQSGTGQVCTASTYQAFVTAPAWVEAGGYTATLEDATRLGRCSATVSDTKAWSGPSVPASSQLTMTCAAFTEPWYICTSGQAALVQVSWTGGTTFHRPTGATGAYDRFGEHCILE